jgi:hypothetical protein
MVPTPEIKIRIETLRTELDDSIAHYQRLAKRNYRFALLLMMITLLSSAAAGVGGLFLGLDGKITGGLALLPGIIALMATTLNPQGRANWHYRKKDALNALRRRLLFELPEAPSADNVASIARDWTEIADSMNGEWEKHFGLNWSTFLKQTDSKVG